MSDAHEPLGEEGEESVRRSDFRLLQRGLRAEWPIPENVRRKLLQVAIDICDPETERGAKAKRREVLAALKTIALYGALNLKQQEVDIKREQLELKKGDGGNRISLADIVAEAEAAAENHAPAERPVEAEASDA